MPASHDVDASAGAYLTDEVFLYRVVCLLGAGRERIVELEDCYRLDVVRVPKRDLDGRRLRVVTPSTEPAGVALAVGSRTPT